MSAHGRVRHTIAAGLLAAAFAVAFLASQFDVDPPGVLYEFWYSAASWLALLGLAVLVAAYVARWWLVLLAATPLTVAVPLQASGHIAPWQEPFPPVAAALFLLFVLLAALVLGVILGRLARRLTQASWRGRR